MRLGWSCKNKGFPGKKERVFCNALLTFCTAKIRLFLRVVVFFQITSGQQD